MQVISQVPAAGEVVVRELADMQGEVCNTPVVLLSQNLGGKQYIGVGHGPVAVDKDGGLFGRSCALQNASSKPRHDVQVSLSLARYMSDSESPGF